MKLLFYPTKFFLSAKKRIFSDFSLIIVLLLTFAVWSNQILGQDLGLKTVVIDAGHGGKDFGAIGHNKTKEKDVTLSVSLKLGNLIKDKYPDIKVIYTRSTDVFIELFERAKLANKASADLFLSIHANSAGNRNAYGTEAWVLGLHKTGAALEVAKRENSSILMEENHEAKYMGFDPTDPESILAVMLQQNVNLEMSLRFAANTQEEFQETLKRKDRGVRQAGFLVLWKTTMPSVLIELGFLSNEEEEKYLASEKGKNELSSSIFTAFEKYKKDFDKVNSEIEKNNIEGDNVPEVTEKNVPAVVAGTKQSITFKVQIASSSRSLERNSLVFKGLKQIDEYISNGVYKYTTGESLDYEGAREVKQVVAGKFSGAFIVAFENGQLISLSRAIEMTK